MNDAQAAFVADTDDGAQVTVERADDYTVEITVTVVVAGVLHARSLTLQPEEVALVAQGVIAMMR